MAERPRTTSNQAFGLAVRRTRTKIGLTQEALAYEAGISLTSIARIETGAHGVRLVTILDLAKALGTSGSDLIGECERILKIAR